MNFSINREVFLENLNTVSRGLPVKSSMPVLTGIKLEVSDHNILLTASNMDISIEVLIKHESLEIKEPGKIVIPGKFFIDIVRKVNSKNITLSVVEKRFLLINVERGEYKLNLMEYSDYPSISFVSLENPLFINSKLFKNIIKETSFATSSSEKKPILTGVNFNLEDSKLKCVATDSYRLSKKELNFENNYKNFNITIPNKSLDELFKILELKNEDLEIYFSNNKILFKFNNVLFQTRLLEGNYPDTSRIIPQSFPIKLIFNKDELIEAVERVSLLSPRDKEKDREITYSTIMLVINKNKKVEVISNNSMIGEAHEELIASTIECDDSLKLAFSSIYLIEALRSFESSDVEINITSDTRPFILKEVNKDDLIQLILPVRIN